MNETIGYVLCGGRSSRMTYPKPLLRWNNMYFADHIAQKLYKGGCKKVYLVGKDSYLYHCKTLFIRDTHQKYHPLCGVLTALQHSSEEQICIAPCDIPELRIEDVKNLIKSSAITYHPKNPLFCLLSKEHLSRVKHYLSQDNSIYDFVSIGNELHVSQTKKILSNFNYPEELNMEKDNTNITFEQISSNDWKTHVSTLDGNILEESWPKIPSSLASMPPIKQILESAGRSRSLAFEDGQFSIYGYPDLSRNSSKVLAIRHIGGLPEIVALHRFPSFVAFGIRNESPQCLHKYIHAIEDTYNKNKEHLSTLNFTLSQAVGIEGKNLLFSRNNEIFRYKQGSNKMGTIEALGKITQALSTLFLQWSQK